jgi:hypothetical protein
MELYHISQFYLGRNFESKRVTLWGDSLEKKKIRKDLVILEINGHICKWVRIDKIKQGYKRGVVWGLGAKVEVLTKLWLARDEYVTNGHYFD